MSTLAGRALTLLLLFGGPAAAFDRWVSEQVPSFIAGGVVFLVGVSATVFVASVPASLIS